MTAASIEHRSSLTSEQTELASKLDAIWGNPLDWAANGEHWTDLSDVKARINERVTGDPHLSSLMWFFKTVGLTQPLPLHKVLVVGCGASGVERRMVQEGWVHHIVATDLSAKALASAQALATELPNIHYVQADMNALPVGEEGAFAIGSFDAVIGISSVHHCTKLEDLYANLVRLLKPSGWLFLDEYVGPDRFQWSSTQLKLLNRVADLLPARLMTTLTGDWRRNFRAPTVEEVVAVDPSEAVRSSELIPIMLRYFDPIEVRPYGGGILHMLLANTAQNLSSEQARVHRQCVIAAEEELYSMGRLSHDFACVIARAPNAAASESSNPCH